MQLILLASRVIAIISSIIVLAANILMLLILLNVLLDNAPYLTLFDHTAIVAGVLPLYVPLGSVSLGTYTLLAGDVIGFVGGIIGTKN